MISMKRVVLVHGVEAAPSNNWFPWMKAELEKIGLKVSVPQMPDTMDPKMDAWVEELAKTVGKPDETCYLVGHSLGCITILRYLEGLNGSVGGAVLVAGFSDIGHEDFPSFFARPIDWKKVKLHCRRFVAIHSDNDPYVPLSEGNILKERLGAELVVKRGMHHFSEDNGIVELPIALEKLLEMSGKTKT